MKLWNNIKVELNSNLIANSKNPVKLFKREEQIHLLWKFVIKLMV